MESALAPVADELLSIIGVTVVFIRDGRPLCVDPSYISFILPPFARVPTGGE
jgi:hypothetical protein